MFLGKELKGKANDFLSKLDGFLSDRNSGDIARTVVALTEINERDFIIVDMDSRGDEVDI